MSEDKTPYGIASQIEAISALIHSEVDTMDIPAIMEKINQLTMYTANAAQLLADAKKNLLNKQLALISSGMPNLSPSIQAKWLQGSLAQEESLVTHCERLNAAITNSIEGLRSILSYAKTEMEQQKHGT